MTNTNPEPLSTNSGTEEQTTQDIADFVSYKGTEFEIQTQPNGLFRVHMKRGGVAPRICEELFTSYVLAERELTKYLIKGDRRGFAQYPSKKARNGKS